MKVPDVTGLVKGLDPRTSHRSGQIQEPDKKVNGQSQDGDSLEISLSSATSVILNASQSDLGVEIPPISEEKLAAIRTRIQSGFYDNPGTAEATTAKILEFYSH